MIKKFHIIYLKVVLSDEAFNVCAIFFALWVFNRIGDGWVGFSRSGVGRIRVFVLRLGGREFPWIYVVLFIFKIFIFCFIGAFVLWLFGFRGWTDWLSEWLIFNSMTTRLGLLYAER